MEESLSGLANQTHLFILFGIWGTVFAGWLLFCSVKFVEKQKQADPRSALCIGLGCLFLAIGLWIPYNPALSYFGSVLHIAFSFTAPFFLAAGFFWMLFSFGKEKRKLFLPSFLFLLVLGGFALGCLWYFGKINGFMEIFLVSGCGLFVQSVGRRL